MAELVEEKRLLPASVDGWKEPAYLHPGRGFPGRSTLARSSLRSTRWSGSASRIERLFGMKYTIEMYMPTPKRVYGYYVFPFLLGDTLVARCDLKADRQRKVLMVQSAFWSRAAGRHVAPELADELRQMQAWLELDRIEVADRGDLAATLRKAASARAR